MQLLKKTTPQSNIVFPGDTIKWRGGGMQRYTVSFLYSKKLGKTKIYSFHEPQCSLKHYLQQTGHGSKPNVHGQMNG